MPLVDPFDQAMCCWGRPIKLLLLLLLLLCWGPL
jgi:hypothetical protein